MRVITFDREYTLYIGARGVWTMHVWTLNRDWVATYHNVSTANPFLSEVEYNAWG